MNETRKVTEKLNETSALLEEAGREISREGEVVLEFVWDTLCDLGALVELAWLSDRAQGLQSDLEEVESFLGSQELHADQLVWTEDDAEVLQTLRRLAAAAQPVAQRLDQVEALYVLINPVHRHGNTLLMENERGVYEDPWMALADLAQAKQSFQNPHLYLARLTSAAPCGEEETDRVDYAASRLYLMLMALVQGEEKPTDALLDWAFETLWDGLGRDPARARAYVEAMLDQAALRAGVAPAEWPTGGEHEGEEGRLRDVIADTVRECLVNIEVEGGSVYERLCEGDALCCTIADDILFAAGLE